jgi:ribose transport system substrate-binding protein
LSWIQEFQLASTKISLPRTIIRGKLAAKHLSELLGGRGNVVLYRTVKGSASTDERGEGFLAYLKEESSKLKVVADIYGGGSRGRSLRSALKLLKETLHIDGIFAVNESSSDGMLRALRESGLAGKIRLIGFDSTDYLLDGLRNKAIDGLIVQNPRQWDTSP